MSNVNIGGEANLARINAVMNVVIRLTRLIEKAGVIAPGSLAADLAGFLKDHEGDGRVSNEELVVIETIRLALQNPK